MLMPAVVTSRELVMRIFTTSHTISVELGSKYLNIAALSYPVSRRLTNVYVAMLRAVEQGEVPCHYAAVMAIVINICLNYVLIFGHSMGIAGHGSRRVRHVADALIDR